MPGGLPSVQRQHQPTLWKLRKLLRLHYGDGLLQRGMHQRDFGSEQLRRLRKRLPRIGSDVQSGRLYCEWGLSGFLRRLGRHVQRLTKLRRVLQCL